MGGNRAVAPPPCHRRPLFTPQAALVLLLICVAWAAFSVALVAQHRAYYSNAFDLGFFDQIIWNTAQGRPFETTFVRYNFLGQHVEPILLLFAAAYRAWPNPEILLVTQATVAAWAALPLFLGARRALASDTAGLLVAAAYLLAPHLHGAVLFDFHPEVMGTAAIFAAFALLTAGRPGWSLAALGTLFLLKEDAALVGIGFALIVWRWGHRRHALALGAASVVYAAVVLAAVMPAIRGGPGDLQERYSYLGADTSSIVRGAVLHPDIVLRRLVAPPQIRAVAWLAGTMAFLPLLTPASLAAAPLLAANLLATHPPQNELTLHYVIFPFALLLVAALSVSRPPGPSPAIPKAARGSGGLGRYPASLFAHPTVPFAPRRRHRGLLLASLLLGAEAVGFVVGSPLGPRRIDLARFQRTEHSRVVDRAIAAVPPDVSVSVQSGLLPHLSQRRAVWEFPRLEDAAYVVVDRRGWRSSQSIAAGYSRVLDALPAQGYCPVFEQDGVGVYVRQDACDGGGPDGAP